MSAGARKIDNIARAVLRRYPKQFSNSPLVPLANAGGFSGASLWRIDLPFQSWCLRAWPADGPAAEELRAIHQWMCDARASGLTFVPELLRDAELQTSTEAAGRRWEITCWMPGKADFHQRATNERLRTACQALAELHVVWGRSEAVIRPCPAVQRRLKRAAEWNSLLRAGWQPSFTDPLVKTAWQLVCRRMDDIPRRLAPWTNRTLPLQPCLRDIWHDHVLYEGDRVSGIIDYGGMKLDYVAADVARLLGSLIEDADEWWAAGVTAYRSVRSWSDEDTAFARVLDETGTVLGVANWLRWIYHDERTFDDDGLVKRRFGRLVQRLARWNDASSYVAQEA
jgi:homoserine kinase type II